MKVLVLEGEVGWDITSREVREQLKEAEGKDIIVEMSSPGGSVIDGIEIFNLLKNYEGHVTTRITGLAASMGSYIALAGDKVEAYDNATYMIHNVWSFAAGDHREMRARADVIEGLTKLLARQYEGKTGKTSEEIRNLMDEETYLFGNDILEMGFVDEILDTSKESTKEEGLAQAKAGVEAVFAKMRQKEESLSKITALLTNCEKSVNCKRDTQKENNKELQMSLKELMAKDPALKAEVEALEKVQFEAGIQEMKQMIAKTSVYLGKTDYPGPINEMALKVLKGEEDFNTLRGAVTVFDAMKEMNASNLAQKETPVDTPPHTPVVAEQADGSISSPEDFEASLKRLKGAK